MVALITLSIGISENLSAQSQLDRISVAERSDGQGFVVRFHLTEAVDSFAFAHIEQQRMQLKLYSEEIYTNEPLLLPDLDVIQNFKIIRVNGGLVFDLLLYDKRLFSGVSYPDVNQQDLLLALTYTVERLREADSPLLEISDKNEEFTEISKDAEAVTNEETQEEEPGEELSEPPKPGDVSEAALKRTHRVSQGDPMELYLRFIGEEPQNARKSQHIRYSGYSGSTEYALMEHDHPWSNHPFFSGVEQESFHSDLTFFNPVIFTSYNSDYPVGGNDGALWQGRGVNYKFSMGAGYENDFLEIVFRPVLVNSNNRDFELSPVPPYEGLSEFAMPLTHSDIPQRFGTDSVNRLDLGDSYLKVDYQGWAAGISNERFRTGPAIHNPLIFGYNAPGFFHTFIGTDEPFEFLKGRFNSRLFWGRLQGSDYLYSDDQMDDLPNTRFITGISINYNPDFLQGLHIGFTRTSLSYLPESGFEIGDMFKAFRRSQKDKYEADPFDARLTKTSLFVRWHFPESGFETYAEWGRYDNRRLLRDMLLEPELNSAYILGFVKRFNAGPGRRVVVNGEITNLENSAVTAQSRDFNIWYTHPVIKHGFTHRGQVLGAPIGPGSSTQRLNVSYYDRFGMVGFSLGRIALHNDRFFQNLDYYKEARARPWIPLIFLHEIEMFGAFHALVFTSGGFEIQADVRYGIIENRNNQYDIDRSTGELQRILFDEPNWNVAFTLRYLLSSRKR